MVTYNSLYRKHYKSPHWDNFEVGEYRRKLDYRIGRRSVEHRHQPWCWDSEDDRGSEIDQLEIASLPSNKDEQYRSQTTSGHDRREGIPNEGKNPTEEAPPPSAVEHQSKQNPRPRTKSRNKKRATKTKSKDKETSVPTSNISKTQREPFVSYGWANDGPIEKKFTYNVKANPKEVYPAALRALKRRELEVRRRLENEKQTAREREIMKEKFFNLGQVSSSFLTEYQRSYCLQNDVPVNAGYDC